MNPPTLTGPIDPFSTAGAQQIAQIAGQQPAPMSASILSTPKVPTLPQPAQTLLPSNPLLPGPDGSLQEFTVSHSTSNDSSIPSIDSILNTPDTPLDAQYNQQNQSIADTQGALAGEIPYRDSQEAANDLAAKKATANDLTTQLNNLKTEADQIPLSLQNDATGRGITAGGLAPIQTAALRNNTIRQLGVSAMLNAANGNIATAQDQIDSAVKAKFDPLRAQLAAQQAQLAALTPLMNKEEQKQVATKNAQLTERTRLLNQQEADQKTVYDTMLTASKYGADAATLRNIQNAATPEAAVLAAGKYTSDPLARQKQQLDIQQAQANIRLTNANASKVLQAAHAVGSGGGGGAGLSQEALDQQAQNYLTTGKLSTLGNGGAAAKIAIINRAAELASGPGGVPAAAAKYAAAANAVKTRTESLTKMLSASSNLEAQFGRLGQLADSVNTSSYRPLNALGVKFKQNLGNDDAAAYSELINTIRSDYSSMQAAVAGSKGAEYFSRAADKAVPDGLTSSQYAKIYQTLQTSSNNAQTAIQGEINSVLDSATVSSTAGQSAAPTPGSTIEQNGMTFKVNADGTATRIK